MSTVGGPLPIIIKTENDERFELDEAALATVLLRDDVRDKPVCVVAVAGAFRKGKSFLLNYFLRYCASQDDENWMRDPSESLEGFDWVKGCERATSGILIWSEPFIVGLEGGEEVAVILMDTQGTFDRDSSLKESTVVFALSALTSSVLVYNLMGNIQGDDLMHLDAFTQYGLLARGESGQEAAFQKLLFLVRDWVHPEKYPYGREGGEQFSADVLQISEQQHPTHQDVRRNLLQCFSDISCYLMPDPGETARKQEDFDGRYSELSTEFVDHLKELVPLLLAPENIEKKTLAGQTINAQDLFNNFKIYIEAFNSKDLPEPATLVECMAKASCEGAVRAAKDLYDKALQNIVRLERVVTSDELETENSHLTQSARELYQHRSAKMMHKVFETCGKELEEELASVFRHYNELNDTNNARKKAEEERHKAEQERDEIELEAAVWAAKEHYEAGMKDIVGQEHVITSDKLEAEHSRLTQEALHLYRSRSRRTSTIDNCEDQLEEDLSMVFNHYKRLRETSSARRIAEVKRNQAQSQLNIMELEAAMRATKELYDEGMKKIVQPERVLSSDELQAEHLRLAQTALEHFRSRCRKANKDAFDDSEQDLEDELFLIFVHYKNLNDTNGAKKKAEEECHKAEQERDNTELEAAAMRAREYYENGMKDTVQPERLLSSDELKTEHTQWAEKALELYRSRIQRMNNVHSDGIESKLKDVLSWVFHHYEQLNATNIAKKRAEDDYNRAEQERNERELEAAVRAAKELYEKGMKTFVQPESELSLDDLETEHSSLILSALDLYRRYRRDSTLTMFDSAENQLKEELSSLFIHYKSVNETNIAKKITEDELHAAERECNVMNLEAACGAAKELYDKGMKGAVRPDRVLSADELEAEHTRWTETALELYRRRDRKTNEIIYNTWENQLKDELALEFDYYKELNETNNAKKKAEEDRHTAEKERNISEIEAAVRTAKEVYEQGMKGIVQPERVLSSSELEAMHVSLVMNALEKFRNRRRQTTKNIFDSMEPKLKKELYLSFLHYIMLNETNQAKNTAEEELHKAEEERKILDLRAAKRAAKDLYDKEMKKFVRPERVLRSDELDAMHAHLCQDALELHQNRSQMSTGSMYDSSKKKLEKELALAFANYKELNETNKARKTAEEERRKAEQERDTTELEAAVRAAKELYDTGMKDVVRPEQMLTSDELENEHSRLRQSALQLYGSRGRPTTRNIFNASKNELKEELDSLFQQYKVQNENTKNQQEEFRKAKQERDENASSKNFYKQVAGFSVAVASGAMAIALPSIVEAVRTTIFEMGL